MKRHLMVLAASLILASSPALAQETVGLGVQVGEPTGFSGKFWTADDRAFDAVASWSMVHNDQFELHGDYLWHDYSLFPEVDTGSLGLYYGVGARVLFQDRSDDRAGVRVPVGLSYIFARRNVELFVEAAPTVDVVPDTHGDLSGALGVHFNIR